MTLAEVLAQDVSERTRIRGNRYFLGGAVRAIEGSETHVAATVRGSEWYHVNLRRERDAIVASCECPHFSDQREACKHLWAVILAADASGFLLGAEPVTDDLYLELDNPNRQAAERDDDAPLGGLPPPAVHEPWRRFLTAVRDHVVRDSATPARHPQGEILYIIDTQSTLANGALTLQVNRRVRKKNGEWGKPQPAAMTVEALEHLPEPADRHILALLLGASEPSDFAAAYTSIYSRATFRLQGPLIETVLALLGQTNRLYLRSVERHPKNRHPRMPELTPLSWDAGAPWVFRLDVTFPESGAIHIDGSFVRGDTRMAVTEPEMVLADGFLITPVATDPEARSSRTDAALEGSRLARLDHAGTFGWLAELRRSGPAVLPPDAAPSLIETMARSNIDPALLPDVLRYAVIATPPHPRIRISRPAGSSAPARREQLEATVQFEYGGTALPANGEATTYDADRRRLIRRDAPAEQAAMQRLHHFGFHKPWYFDTRGGTFAIAVERFPGAVRALVEAGWHVEAEGRVFRAAQALDMQVKSGIDWFELHGRIDFGDGRSVPIAELLAALRRGEATVLLDDGTRGLVPEEWLRRYARVASFGEAAGDHVRYRPSQTALLDALLDSQPSVRVDDSFNRARAELAQFEGVRPLDAPSTFRGRLRDYQREALGWFAFLRQFRFGGCLADDMGLGKTVMVLALLESRRGLEDRRPSLAVVPRSLVFNWVDEAARFAPELRVLDYTGSSRDAARLGDYDLVLTTYGTLRREAARLMEYEFDYVILDEAQAIKNATTASAKSARLLRGQHRLALSGTPIENHLGELWSLFDFLNPGFLGPAGAFGRAIAPTTSASAGGGATAGAAQTSSERGNAAKGDRLDLALIARALRPFILRRTKEQVAPELPPKVEQTIHCELEPSERRFYDELRAHYREKLLAAVARQGMNRSKIQVLEALLRLRQAASHAGLVDPKRAGERSAKFDMLLSRLRELADEGHKALVFSQFTTLLGLLRSQLEQEGLVYEYLDGRTRDRAERVERFERTPECPVFLISLKAGGLGLNLTAADYVFLLDPWWNPAVEAQAIDRAYRIGQTKHVFAYRLIARDTVEEKIADLQQSKRQLADALFAEDAGLMKVLQPEDLEWLLS